MAKTSDKKSLLPPRRKLAAILSVSFASAFTVFIFTPMDLYLNSPLDFVISWRFMLLPLLGVFLLCFIALSVVLAMVWHRKMMLGAALLALHCAEWLLLLRDLCLDYLL